MNDKQEIYPQLIYRTNRILSEIKYLSKINEEQFISLSIFNPYGRVFHWLTVHKDRWKLDDKKKEKEAIKKHIENHKSEWDHFKKSYEKMELESIDKAFENLKPEANIMNDEYHFALLSLHQFYPVNPKKYIDGIIYRNLERRAKEKKTKDFRIDYAIAKLLEDKKPTYLLYPWVEVEFYKGETIDGTKYSCQENNYPYYPEKEDVDDINQIKPIESENYYRTGYPKEFGGNYPTPATKRNNHFHKNYFLPFFYGYEDFKTDNFLELKPKHFTSYQFIVIIPLYDAYPIEGKYYGNLRGILQIPFKDINSTKEFPVQKLKDNSFLLLEAIRNAAVFEIIQQPIGKSHDLLEHYIKWLPILQDWQGIIVWRITEDQKDAEIYYCYKRHKESNEWIKCEDGGIKEINSIKECITCKQDSNGSSYYKELKEWVLEDEKKHISTDEKDFGNRIKHAKCKALLENLFNTKIIPELDYKDEITYKNIRLVYEYPPYTIFPEGESEHRKLGKFYERQQTDLLRQLAIKRKVILETIRHGTRAAVAAIMGRNMSHNIGSHVLSYLSNENEVEDKSNGKFYRYLQGRMDFISDISTTKPSWSSNVNFIEEILNPFVGVELQKPNDQVLPEQAKLLNNILRSVAINHNNERICLDAKKIIIKISYPAQIENKSEHQLTYKYFSSNGNVGLDTSLQEDFLLTIPHGSTGMHAFYSILENFLRNSGKHGGEGVNEILRDSKSTLECSIYVQRYDENLYKVTIRDNIKKDFPDKTISEINEYITRKHSTLINDDGSINQEGWGIKEMRISAAWLRGIEPKEVQNPFISPPLLNPIKTDIGGIGYEFYLLKPLDVLIMTNDSNVKENHSKGIYIKKTIKDLDDLVKNVGLRHKFVIFDRPNENVEKWIREHSLSLPFSTFCILPQFDYHFQVDKDSLLNGDIKNNLSKVLRVYITRKIGARGEIKLAVLEDALKPLLRIRNNILLNSDKVSAECIVFDHDFTTRKNYFRSENPLYYQEYSSVQRTGRRLRRLLEEEGEIGIHKIYISALSKIVIADERFFSKEMSNNSLEEWERMGIEIVDIKRSNNDVMIYKKGTKPPEAWNDYISKNKQVTFFSIHQAIIKDEIKEDAWNKMVEDMLQNKIFILIHSGRGGINITKGFKFVELSNIENMIDNKDKIGLSELFFHYVRGRQND